MLTVPKACDTVGALRAILKERIRDVRLCMWWESDSDKPSSYKRNGLDDEVKIPEPQEVPLVIAIPPFALYFKINNQEISLDELSNPVQNLKSLREKLMDAFGVETKCANLRPLGEWTLNGNGVTWNTYCYQLWSMDGNPGSPTGPRIEIQIPPSRLHFMINRRRFDVSVAKRDTTLKDLYSKILHELNASDMNQIRFEFDENTSISSLWSKEEWPGISETTPLMLIDSELNAIEDGITFPAELTSLVNFAMANKDELAPEFSSANCFNGPSYTDLRYQMPVLLDNLMYNSVQLPENPHSKIPQDVEELKMAICSIMGHSDPPIRDPSFEKFVAGFRGVHEELPAYQAGCTYGEQNENFYVGAAAFVGYVFKFRALNMQWGGNQE